MHTATVLYICASPTLLRFSFLNRIAREKMLWSFLSCVSCSEYRYRGYHDNTYPYGYSRTYWHLLTARLAFVFVFQFIVYTITGFIAWLVPDRPAELQFKAEREKQVIKTVFQETEDYSDIEEYSDNDDDTEVFEDAKQSLPSLQSFETQG